MANKYGAKRTTVDGIKFHSKGEAGRYSQLKLMEKDGLISELELQPKYPIVINGVKVCNVILDFRYIEDGQLIIEDFKGMDPPISKLKRKLVKAVHDIDVKIVK
jgi:hypothetical protein